MQFNSSANLYGSHRSDLYSDHHIVVIGAGIQGAGIAQAFSAAGYEVTVLEKKSIGGATSSNSSKLIHGGLRYLETAQFNLVRTCLKERALLLKLAPELVFLRRFHIPIYRDSLRHSWQIRAGLSLYQLLGGGQYNALKRSQWSSLDGLRHDDLTHVYDYFDAQTDDLQLTRAVMVSAQDLGTECLTEAQVTAIDIGSHGCEVYFHHAGREQQIRAAAVINCAGPWVNSILQRVNPKQPRLDLELVQGSHLLIDNSDIKQHFYLQSPIDKRAFFVLPWQGKLLVGTTETPYYGRPEDVQCLPEEEDYLLRGLYHYFPNKKFSYPIQQRLCGLRVLPQSYEKNAFWRHRETLYQFNQPSNSSIKPRFVTVAGGKLTTYRLSAQTVLKQLKASLVARKAIAQTNSILLTPAK